MLDKYVLPRWKSFKVQDITRGHARDLLDGIKTQQKGDFLHNRVRSLLSKMFNQAIKWDIKGVDINPIVGTDRKKEPKRTQVATDEEIRQVWELGDPVHKLILATAQRPGEVQNLRWSEIEGDVWTIPESRSKNGLAHRVLLSELALDILRSIPRTKDRVFPTRSKKVGVNDLRAHDLRRTASTGMAKLEIPTEAISRVLNHKESGVTEEVYVQYGFDKQKARTLRRWAEELTRIIEKKPAKVIPMGGA